jgi:hypothetical protein
MPAKKYVKAWKPVYSKYFESVGTLTVYESKQGKYVAVSNYLAFDLRSK